MEKQQYSWRVNRRRKRQLTAWLIGAAVLAAVAAFLYEGFSDSSPEQVVRRYIDEKLDRKEYQMTEGEQKLKEDGSFVQTYTVSYTPEGEQTPVSESYDVTKQAEKRYGMFTRWAMMPDVETVGKFELILPAGCTASLDNKVIDMGLAKEDKTLPGGAVRLVLESLEKKEYTLKITGFPFAEYEVKVNPEDKSVNVLKALNLSENAKTQMHETAKEVMKKLYTVALNEGRSKDLGDLFAAVRQQKKLLNSVSGDLKSNPNMEFLGLDFKGFTSEFEKPVFSEPGKGQTVTVKAALDYECEYQGIQYVYEDGENNTRNEDQGTKKMSGQTEAVFVWKDGKCQVQSIEVGNLLKK